MIDVRQWRVGWYESSAATTQDYIPSGTWEFLRFPGSIELANGSADAPLAHERDSRSLVVFTLHIRRKSLYYTVNLCVHIAARCPPPTSTSSMTFATILVVINYF